MPVIYLIWDDLDGQGDYTILSCANEAWQCQRDLASHRRGAENYGISQPCRPNAISTAITLDEHRLRTAAIHLSDNPHDNIMRSRTPGQDIKVCAIWAEDEADESLHIMSAWVNDPESQCSHKRAQEWATKNPDMTMVTGHFYVNSDHIHDLITLPHPV